MRTKIFLLIVILLVAWTCKSPANPGIEETLIEEILKEADIRVTVDPDPIFYGYDNHVYFTAIFKEYDGVEAELEKLWMLVYPDDGIHYVRHLFGYMCPKRLRANGKLELDFNFYVGRQCCGAWRLSQDSQMRTATPKTSKRNLESRKLMGLEDYLFICFAVVCLILIFYELLPNPIKKWRRYGKEQRRTRNKARRQKNHR